ncbi:MAG: hypothetical protein HZY76_04420 [Anaerolineae bacterium]|nr:MAG: hypothetical protein HZY76_04420 [Anaerolineae bacterium]
MAVLRPFYQGLGCDAKRAATAALPTPQPFALSLSKGGPLTGFDRLSPNRSTFA